MSVPTPTHVAAVQETKPPLRAVELRVSGVVQGVGFRPFVHRLAIRHGVAGWVRNEAGSVCILVEGAPESVAAFAHGVQEEPPPLASIDEVRSKPVVPQGFTGFEVARSELTPTGRLPVSPDAAICPECQVELMDPHNRRHRYPFITCTDCGPRFTVIETMPYDRERSTLAAFTQCPACLAEYGDPADRRYHSQTNSCPACGPRLWLGGGGAPELGEDARPEGDAALRQAARLLAQGRILAVRGLGGFHLAVDAESETAVRRLRARKHRDAKPLALMVSSLQDVRALAFASPADEALLLSRERPIVVMKRRPGSSLAEAVAPGLDSVGIMIAYTPLHLLLLGEVGRPLVMTSGNVGGEPIVTDNSEARERLGNIVDAFLLHDREIVARYDDSLIRTVDGAPIFLRRARGYAPLPVPLPVGSPRSFLAVGPHLKNTFTLVQDGDAWVSQHVGDLENVETLAHFHETLERYRTLFRVEPTAVVRDLHPDYLSTRIAEAIGLPELPPVQHHHAHVAAVQGEHGVTGAVLGLAFDGTGYGDDGRVWGGEFLRADLRGYRRLGRLRYARLPGGDKAARSPWRTALGYLCLEPDLGDAFEEAFQGVDAQELSVARHQVARRVNAPEASSLGRLFDAAAAVLGVRREARFEGQGPMELEALAGSAQGRDLPFPVMEGEDGIRVLDPLPLLTALGTLRAHGVPRRELAASFHDSVARATATLAADLCDHEALDTVALGGGCFQNARLLSSVRALLEKKGLRVLVPRILGPNDGAVSYGQAVVTAARLND